MSSAYIQSIPYTNAVHKSGNHTQNQAGQNIKNTMVSNNAIANWIQYLPKDFFSDEFISFNVFRRKSMNIISYS